MLNFSAYRPNRKTLIEGLMAIALFAGFSSVGMAKPDEVQESEVKDCQFLGKVEGSSGYGKNHNWQSLAKSSAINRAGKLGASHIVWEQFIPVGVFNGTAVARAYGCGR